MSEVSDLLNHALNKSPIEFSDTFNDIMRQRSIDAIEAQRVALAQSIYGEPDDESEFDEVDEVDEVDDNEDNDFDLDDFDLDDIDLDGLVDLDDLDNEDNTDEDA